MVVLVLVVLMGLGLAALTTSLASARLGERSGEWYRSYYELDRKAEEKLAVIDNSIHFSDEQTSAYMDSEKYLLEDGDIDDDIQESIHAEWEKNSGSVQAEERIAGMVFLFYLTRELKEKDHGFEELIITGGHSIKISFVEKDTSNNRYKLRVALELTGEKTGYKIIEWMQYNEK